MKKQIGIFLGIILIIAVPLIFRQSFDYVKEADEVLVIITPHNEGLRNEIEVGFRKWYKQKTGKIVKIDWRVPGSTAEIIRYIDSVYLNNFRLHWETELKQPWSQDVQSSFSNPNIILSKNIHNIDSDIKTKARRAFLEARIDCGIDLFWGGGCVEFKREAEMGHLADSGILKTHPEYFVKDIIPESLSGDRLWDESGLWVGVCLSSFGIVYNKDCLKNCEYIGYPNRWNDLTDYRFFKKLAIVDLYSGSVIVKSFEMLIQQQMTIALKNLQEENALKIASNKDQKTSSQDVLMESELSKKAAKIGWEKSMLIIQKIMANARYFTDASTQTVLDVSSGNCTVGILVDFYGCYQEEILRKRTGFSRIGFTLPVGGTNSSADPIAMLKGAPNPELSRNFIAYILSLEGQKIMSFKLGSPGGPQNFPLSRTPIRKDLFSDVYKDYRTNPENNPYNQKESLVYREEWTKHLFQVIRFAAKVAFMDPSTELAAAWKAINEAKIQGRTKDYENALKVFENIEPINYEKANGEIKKSMLSNNRLEEITFQTKLVKHFQSQYKLAKKIARGKGNFLIGN